MPRVLIVLLAAVDAAVAAAVGLALLLAPLTVAWIVAFGVDADWGALWPTTSTLWQLGHGVPVSLALPDAVVREVGIAPEAASFVVSLAPLLFLAFTAIFAARSGRRAASAGSWPSGVVAGVLTFTAISVLVVLTGVGAVASTPWTLGVLFPALTYLCGALAGAVATAWIDGDGGIVDAVHDRMDAAGDWAGVPGDAVRGASAALVALVGSAALAVAVAALLRGGEVVALFEALRVDGLGVTAISLGQLAYLPTLVCWAVAWLAGPGFALGTGTAVSPAGTELGVVPGIPMLGLLPEATSPWMLVVVLIPIGAGALAGWIIRSRQASAGNEPDVLPQATTALAIAVLAAGGAALLAVLSSGSIGPGRLAEVGPDAGPVALAVGIEVLVGAGILLLGPRHRDELRAEELLGTDEVGREDPRG
ncbi:cell division protein PerM [Microbacterium resistens]